MGFSGREMRPGCCSEVADTRPSMRGLCILVGAGIRGLNPCLVFLLVAFCFVQCGDAVPPGSGSFSKRELDSDRHETLQHVTSIRAALNGADGLEQYRKWKRQKPTGSVPHPNAAIEDEERHGFLMNTLDLVEKQNNDAASSWVANVTQFADWSPEELAAFTPPLIIDPQPSGSRRLLSEEHHTSRKLRQLPASLDWRILKPIAVTAVKQQGYCGASQAFAGAAAVESLYGVVRSQVLDISEQEIISCPTSPAGCNGGPITSGLDYCKTKGCLLERSYPYTSFPGTASACRLPSPLPVKYKIDAYTMTRNEADLAQSVAISPTIVGFAAQDAFLTYKSGVFNQSCQPTAAINQAMLAVGWGTDTRSGLDYWIVKNSFGAGWGTGGYALIRKGVNLCQIGALGLRPYFVAPPPPSPPPSPPAPSPPKPPSPRPPPPSP